MFGHEPSEGARYTLDYFKKKNKTFSNENKINLLELGSGLGRDTKYFITETSLINVTAVDYSTEAIKNINKKKLDLKRVETKVWDIRNGLPFKENSFDGCFSHMLYCMALTTKEIINLNKEVKRILKPGGINIFTVRHIGDEDYKNGKHIGEDMYQNDGFIVHFFSKEKIKEISKGFKIESINEFHEGKFPRKLFIATLKKE
tara:strand:+ start:2333 stop:2938 length:606 start_codon:yes stop_codon:yes gene_type:complete